ncbi:MAG: hypothetical protein RBR86_00055 [Pseudobdellovibrionaceae bacterium]|jgi:hypothetical protein|nr:hypothetical protein [Pseudobdellovibrionaceae bacterium]
MSYLVHVFFECYNNRSEFLVCNDSGKISLPSTSSPLAHEDTAMRQCAKELGLQNVGNATHLAIKDRDIFILASCFQDSSELPDTVQPAHVATILAAVEGIPQNICEFLKRTGNQAAGLPAAKLG